MDITPQTWPEWYDGRHINEVLFCQQFLEEHPMKCVRGRLFTVDGLIEDEGQIGNLILEAGINIIYIRDFLGHEDISTTMIYVRADNRLKNDAINALAPKVADETNLPDWNKDKDLLQFLNSLK